MKTTDMLLLAGGAFLLYEFVLKPPATTVPVLTTGGLPYGTTIPATGSTTSILGNILKALGGGSTAAAAATSGGTGSGAYVTPSAQTTADQTGTGTYTYDETGGAYQDGTYVTPYAPTTTTTGGGDSSDLPGGGDGTIDYSNAAYTQ
jgi:hypothetical protein